MGCMVQIMCSYFCLALYLLTLSIYRSQNYATTYLKPCCHQPSIDPSLSSALCYYTPTIYRMLCQKNYAIWIHLHSSCMLFFLSSSLKSIDGRIHDRLLVLRGRPFMQHFRTFSQARIEWPPFSVIIHAPDIALLSNTSIHFLKHFHALNFLI